MSEETFEDCLRSMNLCEKYHIRNYMTDDDCEIIQGKIDWSWEDRESFYIDSFDLRAIWNHQQKKIDELEKELNRYRHEDKYLDIEAENIDLKAKLEKAVGLIRDLRDGVLQIPELSAENFLKDFEELKKGE